MQAALQAVVTRCTGLPRFRPELREGVSAAPEPDGWILCWALALIHGGSREAWGARAKAGRVVPPSTIMLPPSARVAITIVARQENGPLLLA